ncbi:acyl-CoA dehydrogenase family protein [Pseudarthrobacter sp. J75]|uniref:acyl-CoA dehydrogenase family protein n=1 Tax=unclassified Pseudarthrobacter TaxID=2647000 RepID=UPI002E7FD328|nr:MULTISPECIES: acyl-CoA dehydrogenase family protein [unclassified Pseudarthrobacter]MEE2523464.1 acyl-CoA dehydrogenase family protein [Pseudarthrobacter sp. J47]MEE2530439.1 acyl-CoA dehydrogenase family protein [Pseudarthrobacter sp. J75]MEE2570151.1 acyl-CoA dehydrogenase family protein [Pseudarthrobacter sp. J64]
MHIVDLLAPAERERYLEVRELLQSRVRAASIPYWNREEFPWDLLKLLAGAGLGGLQTDGSSALFKGLMYVEVARADVSLSALVGIHNELILGMVNELGSDEQKRRWLPGLAGFTQLGAFALTEPDHGSDIAGGLATTARLDGTEWVINGAKRWIGAGTIADFALVWARDEADGRIKGFIVETDRPGYQATKISNKIGLRIMQNADIVLDEVRIPRDNLLPGATDFSAANSLLRDSRAWVGWQAAGIQLAAFDVARSYALERQQFGRELARFQLIQQQLSEMVGNASASLALMSQLARIQEDGLLEMAQAAMAKATTTRLARDTVAMGRSLLGGNGISSDYEMAKLFGDAEILYTYEGSYEINSLIVGRAVTGKSAFV